MTEAELRRLLDQPESEHVECKPTLLSRRDIAEYAVGIGNAGGGWLLMGVSDRIPRRILPITEPTPEELARIRESVMDSAQIHVEGEVVRTRDGPVVVVRIPGRPRGTPFYTRDGKYLVRLGEGLRGMTLQELDAIRAEAGVDFTATALIGHSAELLSATGMEALRRLLAEAGAASDLARPRSSAWSARWGISCGFSRTAGIPRACGTSFGVSTPHSRASASNSRTGSEPRR